MHRMRGTSRHTVAGTYVVLRVDVIAGLPQSRLDCVQVARPHVVHKRLDVDSTHRLHSHRTRRPAYIAVRYKQETQCP